MPPLSKPGFKRVLSKGRKPYRTKDGYACILPYSDRNWQDFYTFTGRTQFKDDARFQKLSDRVQNIGVLYAMVEEEAPKERTKKWGMLGELGINRYLEEIDDSVRGVRIAAATRLAQFSRRGDVDPAGNKIEDPLAVLTDSQRKAFEKAMVEFRDSQTLSLDHAGGHLVFASFDRQQGRIEEDSVATANGRLAIALGIKGEADSGGRVNPVVVQTSPRNAGAAATWTVHAAATWAVHAAAEVPAVIVGRRRDVQVHR